MNWFIRYMERPIYGEHKLGFTNNNICKSESPNSFGESLLYRMFWTKHTKIHDGILQDILKKCCNNICLIINHYFAMSILMKAYTHSSNQKW